MKITKLITFVICLSFLFAGCAEMQTASSPPDRQDVLYTCNCGPQCKCNDVSAAPGNCSCGTPLKWGHILKIEGTEAILCQCKEGCQCQLDANDPSKCGCGMAVKRVDLAGSGIYFCNCGGSCFCNNASNKVGKCKCGMDLKQR